MSYWEKLPSALDRLGRILRHLFLLASRAVDVEKLYRMESNRQTATVDDVLRGCLLRRPLYMQRY